MQQNLVEKIVQKYTVGLEEKQKVKSGDYVSIRPAYVMTHDNTGAVIPKFRSIGAEKLANPRQVVHTLDHNIQDKSEKNLMKYKKIEEFSKSMGADFYPAGRGIGHQIMCEEGYAFPGTLAVASDSHSNMYGGLGCLGTPIVRTDAAAIWATGRTWWQIPSVAKVELNGKLRPGVTGKDVIIALCGYFNNDEVLNHAIEFSGEGIKDLDLEERLTIANMTTEWGALVGLFPTDDVTIKWLEERADFILKRGLAGVNSDNDSEDGTHPRLNKKRIDELKNELPQFQPDDDAFYSKVLQLDLSTVQPYVSGPNSVKIMNSVTELRNKKIKVNKAYLVSCVNSRVDDIAEAAKVVKGKNVAEEVEFYVAAASSEVQAESEKRGDWQALIDAGAKTLPPGCGPCIGLGMGLLEDGEVGISATNRNFKGRMGSRSAEAYLASPAVVAASAVSGYIDFPWEEDIKLEGEVEITPKEKKESAINKIYPGFPEIIEGDLIYCHQNNLNTDGIYPGKYTYIDDFKPEDQAKVVMENYDPKFKEMVKEEDILVGGYNFGSGSSREQAATALKYKGIACVIAGSYSQTYMRNAINNGFLTLISPDFTDYLKDKFGTDKLTVLTELKAKINFKESLIITDGKEFSMNPLGIAAQELIVQGGLENWVKNNL